MKSRSASFPLWFRTHTMHSYYIVDLALRQNTGHWLGKGALQEYQSSTLSKVNVEAKILSEYILYIM